MGDVVKHYLVKTTHHDIVTITIFCGTNDRREFQHVVSQLCNSMLCALGEESRTQLHRVRGSWKLGSRDLECATSAPAQAHVSAQKLLRGYFPGKQNVYLTSSTSSRSN